jgi:hypothetical protein
MSLTQQASAWLFKEQTVEIESEKKKTRFAGEVAVKIPLFYT